MAPTEGQTGSSVFEGWDKWQVALVVGAPICLGLAGLWYYNKSKKSGTSKKDTGKPKSDSPRKAATPNPNANNNATSTSSPAKVPVEETPLTKAQASKARGNSQFKAGKYDEAIKCYQQALELCPPEHKTEISTFYANMAAAYEKLKNPKLVVENCTKAIELNGKYTKALSRRANAAEQLGDFTQSLEDVTAVCILEGFQNQATLQMADRVLKNLGKTKAKEALQNKKPGMPSRHFVKSYFATFTQDPVQKCFLPNTEEKEVKIVNTDPLDTVETEETQNPSDKTESNEENQPPVMGNPPAEAENHSDDSESQSKTIVNDFTETDDKPTDQVNGDTDMNIPADYPFKNAVENLRADAFGDIVTLCTQQIDLGPKSHYLQLSLLLRGTMYSLMSQTQDALTDLDLLLGQEDLDKKIKVNALIKRGSLYITKEKQTEGLDDFAQAVRIDPSNSDIYHHRGHQNIQLDRLEDAVRDFENSILKNPDFPHSYIQKSYAEHRRAAAEQSTMKLEKAIKSYEETLKKFPDCSDGHALYAQALCDLGRFDDADNEFEIAIKLEPDNANTLVHRALLKLQWKQTIDEPVGLIKQAIDLDDRCEYAYEILGTIEVQRGDMVKAVELFNTAISLCRTETEMSHLFSLLHAAKAQLKAAQTLGIPLPGNFSPM